MVERSLSMREALGSMPRFSILYAGLFNVKTTATGFEPARAEPIGFQVQLLNLSDTLSVRLAYKYEADFLTRTTVSLHRVKSKRPR